MGHATGGGPTGGGFGGTGRSASGISGISSGYGMRDAQAAGLSGPQAAALGREGVSSAATARGFGSSSSSGGWDAASKQAYDKAIAEAVNRAIAQGIAQKERSVFDKAVNDIIGAPFSAINDAFGALGAISKAERGFSKSARGGYFSGDDINNMTAQEKYSKGFGIDPTYGAVSIDAKNAIDEVGLETWGKMSEQEKEAAVKSTAMKNAVESNQLAPYSGYLDSSLVSMSSPNIASRMNAAATAYNAGLISKSALANMANEAATATGLTAARQSITNPGYSSKLDSSQVAQLARTGKLGDVVAGYAGGDLMTGVEGRASIDQAGRAMAGLAPFGAAAGILGLGAIGSSLANTGLIGKAASKIAGSGLLPSSSRISSSLLSKDRTKAALASAGIIGSAINTAKRNSELSGLLGLNTNTSSNPSSTESKSNDSVLAKLWF